ncbi:hypothetical protein TcasGA2_TC012480 [Tribolium castaneum]|uniref:Uncharacterized protein n=1 Tax=Tribolium castaneum TaxID=7070 RepID=D6X2N6_TRICA|nr:hypothetical protein TcasGA2_TC012480 [Tribolium castaneum]
MRVLYSKLLSRGDRSVQKVLFGHNRKTNRNVVETKASLTVIHQSDSPSIVVNNERHYVAGTSRFDVDKISFEIWQTNKAIRELISQNCESEKAPQHNDKFSGTKAICCPIDKNQITGANFNDGKNPTLNAFTFDKLASSGPSGNKIYEMEANTYKFTKPDLDALPDVLIRLWNAYRLSNSSIEKLLSISARTNTFYDNYRTV